MLPDVQVAIADVQAPRLAPQSTATWMVAGYSERGPSNTPVLIQSIGQFATYFGPRDATTDLHDALDVFFREGGRYAYVSRVAGPAAAPSSGNLNGAVNPTLSIEATGPGAWGDLIDVTVENASGGFTITVEYDGTVVESSPLLESEVEAVVWAQVNSAYLSLTDVGAAELPVDQVVTLASGNDDRAGVTETELDAALASFTSDLGPGQVSIPGFTTTAARNALHTHQVATNRIVKWDSTDTSTISTLTAEASAMRAVAGYKFSAPFWPWDTCPGTVVGTERTVPPCARNAALHARALAEGYSVGDPSAGLKLPARYVHGLSQPALSDANRELLNDAGINVSRVVRGSVVTYGNRTLASALIEPNWAQLSQVTVIAAIAGKGQEIAGRYVHERVDGRGVKVGEFVGELEGALLEFYRNGDLYGESPAEAFRIVPETQIGDASATLIATIEARVSPGADRVEIGIYKQPITG